MARCRSRRRCAVRASPRRRGRRWPGSSPVTGWSPRTSETAEGVVPPVPLPRPDGAGNSTGSRSVSTTRPARHGAYCRSRTTTPGFPRGPLRDQRSRDHRGRHSDRPPRRPGEVPDRQRDRVQPVPSGKPQLEAYLRHQGVTDHRPAHRPKARTSGSTKPSVSSSTRTARCPGPTVELVDEFDQYYNTERAHQSLDHPDQTLAQLPGPPEAVPGHPSRRWHRHPRSPQRPPRPAPLPPASPAA